MKMKLLACTVFLAVIVIQSCDNNSLPEPPPVVEGCPDVISFESEIKPIINSSCATPGCHNGDNGPDRNWTVFSNVQGKRLSIKDRINRPPGTPGHMPAVGSLTADQIETITCWVDQGGLNN